MVDQSLRGLDGISDAARRAVPAVSLAKSMTLARENFSKPAQLGVTFPVYQSLPVRDGDYKTLCLKAGDYMGDAAKKVISYVGITNGTVTDFIGGLVKKSVGTYAAPLLWGWRLV